MSNKIGENYFCFLIVIKLSVDVVVYIGVVKLMKYIKLNKKSEPNRTYSKEN